jgi:hypothetical protein
MEPEATPVQRLMRAKAKAIAEEATREEDRKRNEAARAELAKRQEERRAAAKQRVAKPVADPGQGSGFIYEQATPTEERDHAAWALAQAAPKAEDPFEPEAPSTPYERILAGAKRTPPAETQGP